MPQMRPKPLKYILTQIRLLEEPDLEFARQIEQLARECLERLRSGVKTPSDGSCSVEDQAVATGQDEMPERRL